MSIYTHKPTRVEAKKFTGGEKNAKELIQWITEEGGHAAWWQGRVADTDAGKISIPEELHIQTQKGLMIATPGHWVVRKEDSTFYPSKPEVFEKKYAKA